MTIGIEIADLEGNNKQFHISEQISVRPLCDLYISYWRRFGFDELHRLATGSPRRSSGVDMIDDKDESGNNKSNC